MSPMFFLSLALDLCHPFSHWASLACRLLSLFLFLSLALYFKFVDMPINLSLILLTTRIQKQLPLSVFVLIGSLVVSALQYAGGYVISRQNNLELYLGCPTCWLSYFTLVCLWCGRSFGRCTVTWLPNFLGWIDFLTHGAPLRARELHYNFLLFLTSSSSKQPLGVWSDLYVRCMYYAAQCIHGIRKTFSGNMELHIS